MLQDQLGAALTASGIHKEVLPIICFESAGTIGVDSQLRTLLGTTLRLAR